jgi:hypothetical protein
MDIFPYHNLPCHCMFSAFFIQYLSYILPQRQFSNLKWCRSHHKVCSVLETIKAFGWICWGLLSILLIVTIMMLALGNSGSRSNRGTRGTAAATAYTPDTRQTNASATVHDQSRTQPVQAPHGTKQNAHMSQQQPSGPTTTTAPGALYQQDIDRPTGHIV